MNLINKTGWLPSPASDKDKRYTLQSIGLAAPVLPLAACLEEYIARIDDQERWPACVAFGVCNAIEMQRRKLGLSVPPGGFSKAWMYSWCKRLDGIPEEPGTYVKTALLIALNKGLCPDYLCPTDDWLKQDQLADINPIMDREAAAYKIAGFSKLQNSAGQPSLVQIKQALAQGSFVVWAMVVDPEWQDQDKYILRIEGEGLGGHCTYGAGYDDEKVIADLQGFARDVNSWGPTWADGGKADISYSYLQARYPDGTPTLLEAWAFNVGAKKNY